MAGAKSSFCVLATAGVVLLATIDVTGTAATNIPSLFPPATAVTVTARDVAVEVGIAETTRTYGVPRAVDYDSDGDQDVLLGRHMVAAARLYANDGTGSFT